MVYTRINDNDYQLKNRGSMPIENILNLNLINTYKKISGRLYRNSHPTPVSQPTVVLFNQQLASSLGLNLYPDMDKLAQLLSGNDLLQ